MFGMNIVSGLEAVPSAFIAISTASAVVGALTYRALREFMARASPSVLQTRRLEALQAFLLQLDSRVDAAKQMLAGAPLEASGRLSKKEFEALYTRTTGRTISREESELIVDLLGAADKPLGGGQR